MSGSKPVAPIATLGQVALCKDPITFRRDDSGRMVPDPPVRFVVCGLAVRSVGPDGTSEVTRVRMGSTVLQVEEELDGGLLSLRCRGVRGVARWLAEERGAELCEADRYTMQIQATGCGRLTPSNEFEWEVAVDPRTAFWINRPRGGAPGAPPPTPERARDPGRIRRLLEAAPQVRAVVALSHVALPAEGAVEDDGPFFAFRAEAIEARPGHSFDD